MKKMFLMFCCALMLSDFQASAQNVDCENLVSGKSALSTNKFLDNTFIGVSGSVGTALKFDPFLPAEGDVSVRLGKWVTPALGFEIEERVGFTTPRLWLAYLTKTVARTNNLMVNADVDLFQAIRYKENRKFSLIVQGGLGWLHEYGSDNTDDLSCKTGVLVNWNLGKSHAWQFYVEPEIVWNLTNTSKPRFYKENGVIDIEVGFNYRFKNKKKSGGTHNFIKYDISAYESTICELESTNASLQEALDEKPQVIEKEVVKYVKLPQESRTVIMFAQNSSTIEDTDALDELARKDSTIHVRVYGYASPEGSSKYNLKLSQERADNVASYLTEKGMNVDSSEGLGVVGNNSNRVVIIIGEDLYKETHNTQENHEKMTLKEYRESTEHSEEPIRDHGRYPTNH